MLLLKYTVRQYTRRVKGVRMDKVIIHTDDYLYACEIADNNPKSWIQHEAPTYIKSTWEQYCIDIATVMYRNAIRNSRRYTVRKKYRVVILDCAREIVRDLFRINTNVYKHYRCIWRAAQ